MRKKIKPKRDDTLSFSDEDSHPPGKQHRSSQSPGDRAGPRDRPGLDRGSGGQNRYSKAIEVKIIHFLSFKNLFYYLIVSNYNFSRYDFKTDNICWIRTGFQSY